MSPTLIILTGLEVLRGRPSHDVFPALLITAAFGLCALLLRAVTVAGAIAGTVTAFMIYFGLGLGGFVTLVIVFLVTWVSTRLGYRRKQQLGLAESRKGRDAGQVLANIAAAAVFAVLAPRNACFAVAAVAALCEAAADTVQSEIGEIASGRAWLITTFRQVPRGTDGGVTLPGLVAGAFAASLIALASRVVHAVPSGVSDIAGSAGFLGSVIDSVLGATLERAGWLNNNAVNFLSTASAGAISIALLWFRFRQPI